MAFTLEEKARIRHHFAYVNVSAVSTFVLGVPAALQTTFMIEGAWDKILPEAEDLARKLLCRMDQVEEAVFGGIDLADVLETGAVKVNPDRLKELAKYYRIAQQGLANMLGVPPNYFDMRDWVNAGAAGAINVPMR